MSLKKRLKPYLPNTSDKLALVSLADQRPFRAYWPMRLTQIIGGKTWSVSFTRFLTPRPEVIPGDKTYSIEQVGAALNLAADDILEAAEAGDEGLRDAINLMVNAGAAYLAGEATTLEDVAGQSYNEGLDSILGWIRQGTR